MVQELRAELEKKGVTLVAVSKTKSHDEIMKLYDQGQRIFGENRVQELIEKNASLPEDIEWHLIGHLQRNKVKQIAPITAMIHSVDSLRLCAEIDKQARICDRVIPILLQVKIADEDTKFGIDRKELIDFCENSVLRSATYLSVSGVMGMATFSSDTEKVRSEFRNLKESFDQLKTKIYFDNSDFQHISMGMSGDYSIAVEEGSTMVRLGSLLFGAR